MDCFKIQVWLTDSSLFFLGIFKIFILDDYHNVQTITFKGKKKQKIVKTRSKFKQILERSEIYFLTNRKQKNRKQMKNKTTNLAVQFLLHPCQTPENQYWWFGHL